jgi:hypothetical protein
MTYTVKYKLFRMWRWRKLRGVVADGIEGGARWFVLDDDSRIEIPTEDTRFWFSRERMDVIKANLAKARDDAHGE